MKPIQTLIRNPHQIRTSSQEFTVALVSIIVNGKSVALESIEDSSGQKMLRIRLNNDQIAILQKQNKDTHWRILKTGVKKPMGAVGTNTNGNDTKDVQKILQSHCTLDLHTLLQILSKNYGVSLQAHSTLQSLVGDFTDLTLQQTSFE